MKPKIIFPAFVQFSLLLLLCTTLRAQSDDKQRLIALEKRRFDAMTRRDTALLASLLGDSLIFIHSTGVIDDKISFLKDLSSGHITYLFIYPEKVIAKVDGNYGWIYGRANIRFKLSTMTTPIDQYVSFVEVYYLKHYPWQMILCQHAHIDKDAPWYNNMVPQVKGGLIPSIY